MAKYYLHDTVYLYLLTLNQMLAEGNLDYRNGHLFINKTIGQRFVGKHSKRRTDLFIYLFVYFSVQGTQFQRADRSIKERIKHVWKGHGADSEIGKDRQAALNRWTTTDTRWSRKAVSRGSQFNSTFHPSGVVKSSAHLRAGVKAGGASAIVNHTQADRATYTRLRIVGDQAFGVQSIKSNFIMKCDKRTQNIDSLVRMTVQKNIKNT